MTYLCLARAKQSISENGQETFTEGKVYPAIMVKGYYIFLRNNCFFNPILKMPQCSPFLKPEYHENFQTLENDTPNFDAFIFAVMHKIRLIKARHFVHFSKRSFSIRLFSTRHK